MIESEKRDAPLGLRIRPSLKAALAELAEADRRTLASYIELVLEQHVAENGNVAGKVKTATRRKG